MSNQREVIINSIVTLLDGIDKTQYNLKPFVTRGKNHWVDTKSFPILYVASDEPEAIEWIAFDTIEAILKIAILGRIEGSETDLNMLIEDVRKRLLSASNTYKDDTNILEIKTAYDATSSLKEFQAVITVNYFYAAGSA